MRAITKVNGHCGTALDAAPDIVPYITPYEEQTVPLPLVFRHSPEGQRLTYTDATEFDWMFGVLWARMGLAPGKTPLMNTVHPLRQRHCMLERLCRVCGNSAADPDDSSRTWWLMPSGPTDGRTLPYWTTAHAPTCKGHISLALERCPHLRGGAPVAYTVGDYEPTGVLANVYRPRAGSVVEVEPNAVVPLDAFQRLNDVLALQLIVTLIDLRPADVP